MDYTSGPYFVTFPAGVTNVPFSISINDDNILEINEQLLLAIDPLYLPSCVAVGNPGQVTVVIADNDSKL